MDKLKLLKNYCYNTAIEGFEPDTEEMEGEQYVANVFVELPNDIGVENCMIIIESVVNNMQFVVRENFYSGAKDMLNAINKKYELMNDENFEDEWKYEIEEGVFSDNCNEEY